MQQYEKLFFACPYGQYEAVQKAMAGLDARETETTFEQFVYFYVVIHKDHVEEFNRRLQG